LSSKKLSDAASGAAARAGVAAPLIASTHVKARLRIIRLMPHTSALAPRDESALSNNPSTTIPSARRDG
jgi:hypothetical protein